MTAKRFPVVEVFGPTVQGEGVDQGVASIFVRFGGCDFRCDWCDTPHAVLPGEVRQAEKLTAEQILAKIRELEEKVSPDRPEGAGVPWIIITGGNPALHKLDYLIVLLHEYGYQVAVETQGTVWKDWLRDIDRLCVSPKPPSALQDYNLYEVKNFLARAKEYREIEARANDWLFVKIVIFDAIDLEWASDLRDNVSDVLFYLSAGNDAGRTVGNPTREDLRSLAAVRADLLDRSKWLTERVLSEPRWWHEDVIVQSQYHVLLWGNELGR